MHRNFILILAILAVVCFCVVQCVPPVPYGAAQKLAPKNEHRIQGIVADMKDPARQFPGKPYYGASHAELWDKAQRGYWYADVDREWRDGMMPRPPHEPNQMVSMPY